MNDIIKKVSMSPANLILKPDGSMEISTTKELDEGDVFIAPLAEIMFLKGDSPSLFLIDNHLGDKTQEQIDAIAEQARKDYLGIPIIVEGPIEIYTTKLINYPQKEEDTAKAPED